MKREGTLERQVGRESWWCLKSKSSPFAFTVYWFSMKPTVPIPVLAYFCEAAETFWLRAQLLLNQKRNKTGVSMPNRFVAFVCASGSTELYTWSVNIKYCIVSV